MLPPQLPTCVALGKECHLTREDLMRPGSQQMAQCRQESNRLGDRVDLVVRLGSDTAWVTNHAGSHRNEYGNLNPKPRTDPHKREQLVHQILGNPG